jgi:hypothetical protein
MMLFQGFVLYAFLQRCAQQDIGGLNRPRRPDSTPDEESGGVLVWLRVPHVIATAVIVHGDVAIGVV